MNEAYELWDECMGNLVAWGETSQELLTLVRSYVEEYGPAVAQSWSLLAVASDESASTRLIAEGNDLVAQAQQDTVTA